MPERIRLAVINTHPIQHFAPLWAEIARRSIVDLRVMFCCDWGVREYGDPDFAVQLTWDIDLTAGYTHEFLPLRRRPSNLGFTSIDNKTVGRSLRAFKPHALLLFGYALRTNWRALLWARRHLVPVLSFSDSELKHERGPARRLAKWPLVRAFYKMVDVVFFIGNENKQYHRHYGVDEARLRWCPYPVDMQRLSGVAADRAIRDRARRAMGIAPGERVFIAVGKYIPRKRHADVIRAWIHLSAEDRDRSSVLLVGEGPDREVFESYRRQWPDRIRLTGFVNQSAMPSMYAVGDVMVVASERDAHPLVVTEALAFGLPIIVSDRVGCIGPDDTARLGENAVVYPCGDVRGLSQAMSRILADEEWAQALGRASLSISRTQGCAEAAVQVERAVLEVATRRRGRHG